MLVKKWCDMTEKKSLYDPALMKLFRETPYRGTLANATFTTEKVSPSCGDRVIFSGIVEDDTIKDLKFAGEASMVSQAFASLLCEYVIGKSIEEVCRLGPADVERFLVEKLGLKLGPTRFKVVLFVLDVLKSGLRGHVGPGVNCANDTVDSL